MRTARRRSRINKNYLTTRSGTTIKINRSIGDRLKARQELKAERKAKRMSGLPKSRVKRFFYHLQPKRVYHYWFSRDGAIMALKIMGIGFIAGFLILVGLFAYFRKDLPDLHGLAGKNIGGSNTYYDRTNKTLLYEDDAAVKRIIVDDKDMSVYSKDATIAVEDKDFFKHSGFDVRGIARAGINDAFGHGGTQGGSTITQQLVKLNQDWTQQRTLSRKVKELILAMEMERSYTKQEILAGYLNIAPYGGVDYGIEAAARDYFNKSAKDLTLDEAAMLAAIPKSPTFYSPRNDIDDPKHQYLIGRQRYILDLMAQQGMITNKQRDAAKKVDVLAKVKPRQTKYAGIKAPYFVLAAKEQLEKKYGAETFRRGGWRIITTVDLKLQKLAEDQVKKGLPQVMRQGGDTSAFTAEDVETGQVVALVGGTDFTNTQFGQNNYARLGLAPGSSFKPYDYTSLIANTKNFGAGSVLYDSQGPVGAYTCTNKAQPPRGNCIWDYDRRYPGPLTLRYAIGGSRNVPAVKAMAIAGIDKTITVANKLMDTGNNNYSGGYKCYGDVARTKEISCGLASAIGDGAYLRLNEHVHGYASLSRNGLNIPQTYILKIEDAQGKTIDQWKPTKGVQAVNPQAAYIVDDMISDPRPSYFPAGGKPQVYANRLGTWKFGVKTGTTNDAKDGWMMGFSTKYAAGVWVGYHSGHVSMSGAMEVMTEPIWRGWMEGAHANLKPTERPKPNGIQSLPAFVIRKHVGYGSQEPSPSTDLFPSWYQNTSKAAKGKQTIDIVSGKLATDCTPPRARKVVDNSQANAFSGDIFYGFNRGTSTQKDDVHKCSDIKPSITLSISGPHGDGSYDLTAAVTQGTHPLTSTQYKGTVSFSIDGNELPGGSYQINSSGAVVYHNYHPDFSGTKTVTATIVDSVLYDGTDTGTVSGTGSSPSITSAQVTGANTKFKWSGGSGTVTIYNADTDTPLCSGGSSCTASALSAPIGTPVYAQDEDGHKSGNATVSA